MPAFALPGLLVAFGLLTVQAIPAQPATEDAAGQSLAPACPASLTPGSHDYHGLTLTVCNFKGQNLASANFEGTTLTNINFTGQNLANANFRNATLTGANFIKATLTGADFSNATILDSGNPVLSTDFSFAKLDNAKFIGTRFEGATYLTHAALTCADFSHTVLDNGNAIFGDSKLTLASDPGTSCRLEFQHATMSCELIAQWNQFDLTDADISACTSEIEPGRDFSNAQMSGVNFSGLNLSNTKWTGAVLEGANFQGATLDGATGLSGSSAAPSKLSGASFNQASVRSVDFSNAELYGADFTEADLTGSSFAGAFLTSNPPKIVPSARFTRAHLKNVNLAGAHLQGVDFGYASLYGSFDGRAPSFPCYPGCSSARNFPCGCPSAAGADLTQTNFSNAFLFGVDFASSTTKINGTLFNNAILVAADFHSADFSVDGGAAPNFSGALLQGTNLGADSNLVNALLTGAFVDFGAQSNRLQGNLLYLQLPTNYTRFRNWPGAASPCVEATYAAFTRAPPSESMTCPNGEKKVCGAGSPAPQANPNWANGIPLGTNSSVKGWYFSDATYDKGTAPAVCGVVGLIPDTNW